MPQDRVRFNDIRYHPQMQLKSFQTKFQVQSSLLATDLNRTALGTRYSLYRRAPRRETGFDEGDSKYLGDQDQANSKITTYVGKPVSAKANKFGATCGNF
jgi:hypothetical protein